MQHVEVADAEDFARIRETQIDFVLRLLGRAVERLKMALILPRLATDFENVSRMLQGTDYEEAIQYLRSLHGLKGANSQLINSQVMHIIDYFLRHCEMATMFPRFLNNLSEDNRKLLVAFETILAVARQHLNRTAKAEISMERQLHVLYQAEEQTKAKIETYKKELQFKRVVLRWKQAAKYLIFDKQENDLTSRKWKNNVHIQNEIEKRARIQRENQKNCLLKQKELEEELEVQRFEYEKLIFYNAREEKEIRAEKNKLLIQLEGTIRKYDTNISEKLCVNLELEDQYKVAKKELDDFMVYFRKEEAVYKQIVVKYEQEERRKQQQKILLFMMNRAARKIQAYWQKWRKDQKKKARKAKKSKKK